jgi:hypothetical protein
VQTNWKWLIWQLKIVKGVDRKKKRLSNTLLATRKNRAWFRNYSADTKFEDYKKILHKYYKVVTVGKLFEFYKNATNGKLTNLNHISSVRRLNWKFYNREAKCLVHKKQVLITGFLTYLLHLQQHNFNLSHIKTNDKQKMWTK